MLSRVFVILVLSVVSLGFARANSPRKILIEVHEAEVPWADSKLDHKISRQLSRNPQLTVCSTSETPEVVPVFPSDCFDNDSLFDWGAEKGGRYLLVVTVESERMERKKTFSLPLIFHRYEVVGTIEGELKLLDIANRRLLASETFKVHKKGPRQFQGSPDDDIYDASLHLPAPERTQFFSELEDKLVDLVEKKVRHLTRGR